MPSSLADIAALAAQNLDRPVSAEIRAVADRILKLRPRTAVILAYGSCLRGASTGETLIDLYALMERDDDVSTHALGRLAARLVPPNVYYAEAEHDGRVLRCKYAVMTLADFAARMKPDAANPYFWARFAQPAALVYAAHESHRQAILSAMGDAVTTMFKTALASASKGAAALDVWRHGFEETYRTELRPEAGHRSQEIVAANRGFYEQAARLIGTAQVLPVSWWRRRLAGKALSLARLLKAAFTFEGGAAYAAWKIERHTGQKIALTPWQRRHPVLAGLMLLPKLLWLGAIR